MIIKHVLNTENTKVTICNLNENTIQSNKRFDYSRELLNSGSLSGHF